MLQKVEKQNVELQDVESYKRQNNKSLKITKRRKRSNITKSQKRSKITLQFRKNSLKIFFTENQKGDEKFPWVFSSSKQCRKKQKCQKLQKAGKNNESMNYLDIRLVVTVYENFRGLFI